MLHEISIPDLKATGQWDVPSAICGEFGGVTQGLYAFLFVNDSDVNVFDNNAAPKIVVHRRARSLKPGKFEQGLTARLQNYNAHLHRVHTDGSQLWVLHETLRAGYFIDLTTAADSLPNPARVFERYWSEAVNAFLDANRLLDADPAKQTARSEWRHLHRDRWTPSIQSEFRSYLEEVSSRIYAMIDIGRLPAARRHSSAAPNLDASVDIGEWIPEQRLA